jgi:hypothetical protein
MASDRSKPENLRSEVPEVVGSVHPAAEQDLGRLFAQDMVEVADEIRQLNADFGLRPYRVFLVHQLWTGPARGMGQPEEVSRVELLPTPRVEDMTATGRALHAVGLTEDGSLRLAEISARYTEDELLGRTPDVRDPVLPRTGKRAMEFYYEVVHQRRRDDPALRRRYVPDAAADLKPGKFGWTVHLKKQQGDAARDGGLSRTRL